MFLMQQLSCHREILWFIDKLLIEAVIIAPNSDKFCHYLANPVFNANKRENGAKDFQ
jgi:hypothetical protein